MNKVLTIVQLVIGVIVIAFAFTMFWQAFTAIFPSLKEFLKVSQFPYILTITPFNKWLQLVIAVFIAQVVAVYTKQLFDKLSVSSKKS